MFRKLGVILVACSSLLTTAAPHANANIFASGVCVLKFAFHFSNGTVGPGATTSPTFTMTVTNGPVDFSPDAVSGWAGTQPCALASTTAIADYARSTSIALGAGSSSIWSCAGAVAGGSFSQGWFMRSGQSDPPGPDVTFGLDGTWGSWELTFKSITSSPLVEGAIHLVPDPSFPTEGATCLLTGLATIHMIGVEVFNDPELPA